MNNWYRWEQINNYHLFCKVDSKGQVIWTVVQDSYPSHNSITFDSRKDAWESVGVFVT